MSEANDLILLEFSFATFPISIALSLIISIGLTLSLSIYKLSICLQIDKENKASSSKIHFFCYCSKSVNCKPCYQMKCLNFNKEIPFLFFILWLPWLFRKLLCLTTKLYVRSGYYYGSRCTTPFLYSGRARYILKRTGGRIYIYCMPLTPAVYESCLPLLPFSILGFP